jgi:hypothetical protein
VFLRIRKSILFEPKTFLRLFEKIDFTPFSLVFRPNLSVVKIKKTQESTPIIFKRITEDKENIVLLPVVTPLSKFGCRLHKTKKHTHKGFPLMYYGAEFATSFSA